MTAKIVVEDNFKVEARKLPPNRRTAAINALAKFMQEPALPSLKFRPLATKSGYFIISSAHGDRIILRKLDDNVFAAVDVGPHDNVYRRWNRR